MRVHYHLDQLPSFRRAVMTIGTFDGVHTGHRQLLQQLREEATRIDGETVIITFHPHPRKIVSGHTKEIRLINTLEEKIELLARAGVDHLVVVPFTEAFSQIEAADYIQTFLVDRFHPHTIIIGYDHQFGRGRLGDYHLLETYSGPLAYRLLEIPVHVLDTISVSSTRIREALTNADIVTANALLGYPFFFSGQVMEGNKLGRTIGYPTANLTIPQPEKILPGDGVYAVRVTLLADGVADAAHTPGLNGVPAGTGDGAAHFSFAEPVFGGMMNIGLRPTVDGRKRVIEVNLFKFSQNIYGRTLRVWLVKHLRDEVKFSGLDALKEQLGDDREHALQALATN